MPSANFLTLNPGDVDELHVEIQTTGAVQRLDASGISKRRALGGAMLVTQTFAPRKTLSGTTGWLTTDAFETLKSAAKYPQKIVVSGEWLRTMNEHTPLPEMNAIVEVTEADYFDNGESDFWHVARVVVEQAD